MKRRPKRRYVLNARREQLEATRSRIVAAAVSLHEELGPRHTSVKAIAERAGVERLTVYRHFPDERAILRACSTSWIQQNPPPDPADWAAETDPASQTALALGALYGYFSHARGMLTSVLRDREHVAGLPEVMRDFEQYLSNLAADLRKAWAPRASETSPVAITSAHAVQFSTWQSLEAAGANDAAKAAIVATWLRAAARR